MNSVNKEKEVKYSVISHPVGCVLPEKSCDCHHHIFDPRFPWAPGDTRNLPAATVKDYQHFRQRLGLQRNVIVQPSSYGDDNRCLLAALRYFGGEARGEAVITPAISDAQLDELAEAGVTGIRFNFGAKAVTTPDMILPLAHRVAERGWHIQFHAPADTLLELKPFIEKVPNRIVIDHFFRLPQPTPMVHPAWRFAWELIDKGNCWVKLSALYHQSAVADVADMSAVIQAFISQATERVLYGSDWPHPNLISANKPMPDDALILNRLFEWAQNTYCRHRLFVANAEEFYRFN